MGMTERALRSGVRRLLAAARTEEWTFHRALPAEERERAGEPGAESIKELVARASAGRRAAAQELHAIRQSGEASGCEDPTVGPVGSWIEVHRDAHEAAGQLLTALDSVDEDSLAAEPGQRRDHPQYVWRDVAIYAVRMPMLSYAEWYHRRGDDVAAIGVLCRWYEAVRGTDLPTKALADASYDLACGYARAGRADEAMEYLPDAFAYNDRAGVPVLKAWARQDGDLSALRERTDFRSLVSLGAPSESRSDSVGLSA